MINELIKKYEGYVDAGINPRKALWRSRDSLLALKLYKNGATPAEIAEKVGYSERSVIHKLASLKVYKKPSLSTPIKVNDYKRQIETLLDIKLSETAFRYQNLVKEDWRMIVDGITRKFAS